MPAGNPGGAVYIPGKGTIIRGKGGKAKSFQGSGPAPSGTTKEPEATYQTAPTITTHNGTVTTSGFKSEQARRRALRRAAASYRRTQRILRTTLPKPQKAAKPPKPYKAPKPVEHGYTQSEHIAKQIASQIGGTPAELKKITQAAAQSHKDFIAEGNKAPKPLPPKPAAKRLKREYRQTKKVLSKSGGHLTGDLGPEQRKFIRGVAKNTHLKPRTIAAQARAEEGNGAQTEAEQTHNFLNMGPGIKYGSLKEAVKATSHNYNTSPYYAGVRATRGQPAAAQAKAIASSPWGTGPLIEQTLSEVGFKGKPNPQAQHKLQRIQAEAKEKGVKLPVDVKRGAGRTIKVRADAQGAVKWAESQVNTQEGSAKQLKWADKFGLAHTEPWCANFISNDLLRRGIKNLPSNPNYVPSYESEWGKYAVPASKIKPGDLVTFSGEHIGMYVGNGEMISGNSSNAVSRTPVGTPSMVIRPPYKGGFISVKETTPLPGTASPTASPSSSAAPVSSAGTTQSKPGFSKQPIRLTPRQKVKQAQATLKSLTLAPSSGPSTTELDRLEKKYGTAA